MADFQIVTEPGPVTVGRDATEGPQGGWFGSALDLAGRAYKRAAGWDFSPGESGKWLVMLAPAEGWSGGDGDLWSFTGHLVGFVVLNDHDDDGTYEAVAHVWTAAAWAAPGDRSMAPGSGEGPIRVQRHRRAIQ